MNEQLDLVNLQTLLTAERPSASNRSWPWPSRTAWT